MLVAFLFTMECELSNPFPLYIKSKKTGPVNFVLLVLVSVVLVLDTT